MVSSFLTFVDAATMFGSKHISSSELFRMFSQKNTLSQSKEAWLRYQLESRGIL